MKIPKIHLPFSEEDLMTSAYTFDLPPSLIAERPCQKREEARMCYLPDSDLSRIQHKMFSDLPTILPKGSLLVFNETKVWPSRLFGQKPTGGKVELFFISLDQQMIPTSFASLYHKTQDTFVAFIKASGKRTVGEIFFVGEDWRFEILSMSEEDRCFLLRGTCKRSSSSVRESLKALLLQQGHIPIPPYIRKGESDQQDKEDYQTSFAKQWGSLAAPTAGLHFSTELLGKLRSKGVEFAFLNLHVGLGTFLPVKAQSLLDHKMHEEMFEVDQKEWKKIQKAQQEERPIIPVGTTSLRTLQSMVNSEGLFINFDETSFRGHTGIFLYPGRPILGISGLITNFHLPGSTLMMLVSAFIGREKVQNLYAQVIKERYRFFSYGDGLFLDFFSSL